MDSNNFIFFFFFFILKSSLSSSLLHSSTFPNNFILYDDAHFVKDTISLTRELHGSVGRAFHTFPIRFLDPSTNSTASFSCTFSFTITTTPSSLSGDGLSFLITSNATSGYMGLPHRAMGVQELFLAVEFDTSIDPELGDVNDNHISLNIGDTIGSLVSVRGEAMGVDLKSGKKITSWVEYDDAKKTMSIWVSYSSFKPSGPGISTSIDLSENLSKEFMHVGFFASNGPRGSARHVVQIWEFRTFGVLSTVTVKDTGEEQDGEGWWMWFLENDYFDAICRYAWTRRLKGSVSFDRVSRVTDGFRLTRFIGVGESAIVYEARAFFGTHVAIKKFHKMGRVEDFEHLAAERAATISSLKHKNLVQLLAWCCDENELVLVYEYVDPQNLYEILGVFAVTSLLELNWKRSVNIITGIASALVYLHERQLVHANIKTSNIMLDGNHNAKLGDFGFLKLYEVPTAEITAIRRASLAPEYVSLLEATEKTDVYSFGVVVLEVVTGRRPVDDYEVVLVDKARELRAEGKLLEIAADCRLSNMYVRCEMLRMLKLGLACVCPDPTRRPTMKEVESMLRGDAQVPAFEEP